MPANHHSRVPGVTACPPAAANRVDTEKEVVPLRPYQQRIAAQAIAARSSVVLLPTGAGKTNVAAAFLRDFFTRSSATSTRRQAIFLVPTIPLIAQQIAALRPFIPNHIPILRIRGGSTVKLAPATSPALYVGVPEATRRQLAMRNSGNETNDGKSSGNKQLGTLINMIGAVVFDEVHHAHDAHPYKKILVQLAAASGASVPRSDVVAVLGLTASLCHARTLVDVRQRIAALLVLLGVGPHAVFTASSEEIDKDGCVLPPPPTEIDFDTSTLQCVALQNPQSPLVSMAGAVKRGEGEVLPLTAELFRSIMVFEKVLGDVFANGGGDGRGKSTFPQAITDVWTKGTNVAASLLSVDLAPFIDRSADCRALCRLTDALRLIAVSSQLAADTAWHYLSCYPGAKADLDAASPALAPSVKRVLDAGAASFASPSSADTGGGYRVPPRFAVLADLLRVHCLSPPVANESGTKAAAKTATKVQHISDQRRAIVFVRERFSANIIAHFINQTFSANASEQKIAHAFVSTGGDAPSPFIPKLSAAEAERILEGFNNGHVRILVATTVAEEGLDVQRCAAIIHFERPSNPVAYAQRTGRARAANSAAIVLDGTVREHQMALEFQREVVSDKEKLAAEMVLASKKRELAFQQIQRQQKGAKAAS